MSSPKTEKERALDEYRRSFNLYKRAFTKKLHPNLWSNIREVYEKVNIDDYLDKIQNDPDAPSTHYGIHQRLLAESHPDNYSLLSEKYSCVSIHSDKPTRGGWKDYEDCKRELKNKLDNKENFYYSWKGNYDISVSGEMGDDGIYRAWYDKEYRGTGNGHYYLLINENQAVFAEDD